MLNDLLNNTMKKLPSKDYEYCLEAVVCCLSGGGTQLAQEMLLREFSKLKINYKVFITNDALATVFTAFKEGILFSFIFFLKLLLS
jgi:hypothetical protein